MFTKEDITFDNLCETFAVSKGDLYLDMNEGLPQLTLAESKELEKLDKAWHSDSSEALDKFLKKCNYDAEYVGERYSELCKKEEKSHNLHFIGRVGQFTPILEGSGGGVLYRVNDGKKYAATGSTGYRWMESEVIKASKKEDCIDTKYYEDLVTNAISDICDYGDYTWFVSDDPYVGPDFVPGEEMSYPVYPETVTFN